MKVDLRSWIASETNMSSWPEAPSSLGGERFEDIKICVGALSCVDALVCNYMFVVDAAKVLNVAQDETCWMKCPALPRRSIAAATVTFGVHP
jgi:hypothetical protein